MVNTYTIEVQHTFPNEPSHQDTVLSLNNTLLQLLGIGIHIRSSYESSRDYKQSDDPQIMLNDIANNMEEFVLGQRTHRNKLYYHLNIAVSGTLHEVKKVLSEWCTSSNTKLINTVLKSTSNCTIGWLDYIHPDLTFAPSIVEELQTRLNTKSPSNSKNSPLYSRMHPLGV